jgi:hypothetical protein
VRSTVLVGSGRAQELARLLGTVARMPLGTGFTRGHVLVDPDGRWRIEVAPDGSMDIWTQDGTALLRGRLATPRVAAAIVKIPYLPCVHCGIPTTDRNHNGEAAHPECPLPAQASGPVLVGGRS